MAFSLLLQPLMRRVDDGDVGIAEAGSHSIKPSPRQLIHLAKVGVSGSAEVMLCQAGSKNSNLCCRSYV
jgi:hypothetical protein